jgi:hypothetical protein
LQFGIVHQQTHEQRAIRGATKLRENNADIAIEHGVLNRLRFSQNIGREGLAILRGSLNGCCKTKQYIAIDTKRAGRGLLAATATRADADIVARAIKGQFDPERRWLRHARCS